MANQQQLQALNVPYTTPIITEHDHEGTDIYHDDAAAGSSGCFRLFCCFDNHRHDGETAGFLYQNQSGDLINEDTWFMRRAKSLKEYSEVVAGPKWKNFIRRFSRRPKTTRSNGFQYDLQSYALNFNGGDDREDDDLLPRSFSTRFAPPSRSMQV
ncbi:hypothetical protein SSX86_026220 [Deinandra increscens subsp. villosa]|uniref:Uncharacterized protein n=1 Tax=Deinandra increscens subsp. villosa TaxID=3103831 RepID=A0AAP0GM24_9ASTR